jgi:MFS transporter, PPP family, 3-phenylpropionic acid transporter
LPAVLTGAGIRTSFYYSAFFMALGAHLPFWPLWLAEWGLSTGEVGLYTALGAGIRVVAAIVIPAIADRLDARRHTISVAATTCAMIFLAHFAIDERGVLLVATLASGAVIAGIGPIGEALGVAAARAHAFPYAHARAIGSSGFLFASLLVGVLVPVLHIDFVLWWIAAFFLIVAISAQGHPGGRRVKGQIPPNLMEIRRLLLHKTFVVFIVAMGLLQGSHAVFYAYGSVHWRSLGLGEGTIGALWALGVAAEILFMFTIGTSLVGRVGPVRALYLSGIAGILRWGVMCFDPIGWLNALLQGLHALTFAVAHLGAMAFIARSIEPRLGASAQGALSALAGGLALATGMALAGLLYPTLGGTTYLIGVGFSTCGLIATYALSKLWDGSTVSA